MTLTTTDIKNIISKQIRKPLEEITDDKLMHNNLGVDSLDTVEILLTLEEDYNVVVAEDQLHKGMTVAEFVSTIMLIVNK